MSVLIIASQVTQADTLGIAKLVAVIESSDNELRPYQIIRQWEPMDATEADTALATIRTAATVTDPKVDNQTPKTGTFTNSDVRIVALPGGKRWVGLRQTLTLPHQKAGGSWAVADAVFVRRAAANGKQERAYIHAYPNVTSSDVTTLLGPEATPGIARSSITLNSVVYPHDGVRVIEHLDTGLKTVVQRLRIPRNSGSGATDKEPYKISIVSVKGHNYRLTESRDFGLSQAAAEDYADTAGGSSPVGYDGRGSAARNMGYIIKESSGTTYTGVKFLWSAIDQNTINTP